MYSEWHILYHVLVFCCWVLNWQQATGFIFEESGGDGEGAQENKASMAARTGSERHRKRAIQGRRSTRSEVRLQNI